MLSPLTTDYKDKPPRWYSKILMLSTRLLRSKRLLVLLLFFAAFYYLGPELGDIRVQHEVSFSNVDEDLYVDKSLYARSFKASIDDARRRAPIHPIANIHFLLNGLTSMDTNLVDLACKMASNNVESMVHVTILGHGSLGVKEYQERNGFENNCPVTFHDARPSISLNHAGHTIELSSYADHALRTILREPPKAIVYTHSSFEPKPSYFLATVARFKTSATFIELAPENIASSGWMTRLGALALSTWNRPVIDLVIDTSESTGNLQRLLDSIKEAQYFTQHRPNIFIEFDHDSRVAIRALVAKFAGSWPKGKLHTRRKRKSSHFVQVESWYPATGDNFALFLNGRHELSPNYYQYLSMMLLRYRYDDPGRLGMWRSKQYGIALSSVFDSQLQVPQMLLDYKNDVSSVKDSRSPILHHRAKFDGPVLLYPEFINTLHEVLDSDDEEVEQLSDTAQLLGYLVEPNYMVLLYPPAFLTEEGSETLARIHPREDANEDGGDLSGAKPLQLQKSVRWYDNIGGNNGNHLHDDLPRWSELFLFDKDGARQSINSFFQETYV